MTLRHMDGFGASEEAAPQTKPHQVVNPAQVCYPRLLHPRLLPHPRLSLRFRPHALAGAHPKNAAPAASRAPEAGASRPLQNNTQVATTERARGEQVVQSSRGTYVLPSRRCWFWSSRQGVLRGNQHMVEALTERAGAVQGGCSGSPALLVRSDRDPLTRLSWVPPPRLGDVTALSKEHCVRCGETRCSYLSPIWVSPRSVLRFSPDREIRRPG